MIRPALAAGTTVVCARFADSTLAYQGYGGGLPLEDAAGASSTIATGGLRPDLTILLDLPVEIGLAPQGARTTGPGSRPAFDLDFHRRVRDGFLAIAAAEPEPIRGRRRRPPAEDAVWARFVRPSTGSAAPTGAAGEPEPAAPRIQR